MGFLFWVWLWFVWWRREELLMVPNSTASNKYLSITIINADEMSHDDNNASKKSSNG